MTERDLADLAPETVNREQEDEESQAQSVADKARSRGSDVGLQDSEKVKTGDISDDAQDLVDHMKHMDTSGQIDMGAYEGERDDDDAAEDDS